MSQVQAFARSKLQRRGGIGWLALAEAKLKDSQPQKQDKVAPEKADRVAKGQKAGPGKIAQGIPVEVPEIGEAAR